jgi:hypothetical protein
LAIHLDGRRGHKIVLEVGSTIYGHLTTATGETKVATGIQSLEEFKVKMMTTTRES